MVWFTGADYWLSRLVFQRGLAVLYGIAFVGSAVQFWALIGERGLLPVPRFVAAVPFRRAPSIFHWNYSDRFFAAVAWAGGALSAAVAAGAADLVPLWAAMVMWALLWALYLSIVNVGQTWYAFIWESLLLEAGFLAVFLGNDEVVPPVLVRWLLVWLLFRLEFGAGLIKLRGDRCWRDLTCLYYHHETQPMPGPLSWFFHHLPRPVHRAEAAGNHLAQLIAPPLLFAPWPIVDGAAAFIIITQLWLIASGNFAWLNWLTILLALSAIDGVHGHLRLDWLMWFAAISPVYASPWFMVLLLRLLENDRAVLRLLRRNPFPAAPPPLARARLYTGSPHGVNCAPPGPGGSAPSCRTTCRRSCGPSPPTKQHLEIEKRTWQNTIGGFDHYGRERGAAVPDDASSPGSRSADRPQWIRRRPRR